MLFKQNILDAIASGKVDLAFRRWARPSVKAGGTLRTPIGVLAIASVETVADAAITEREARRAGFESRQDLLGELQRWRNGALHRIQFQLIGDDPRIALRERANLSAADRADLESRLARLDRASRLGPWTRAMLELIARAPAVRAGDLAEISGHEKEWIKLNVRKLKNLGLTESLGTGYRISPRGKAFLDG